MGARADLEPNESLNTKFNGQALGRETTARSIFGEFRIHFSDVLSAVLVVTLAYIVTRPSLDVNHLAAAVLTVVSILILSNSSKISAKLRLPGSAIDLTQETTPAPRGPT